MSEAHTSSRSSRTRRGRKRLVVRVVVLGAVLVPLLVAVSLWVATRSWFIIWVATPQLERKLGGEVEIDTAAYRGNGMLVLEQITLRTRVREGPAGQVFRIGRVTVVVDMSTILSDRLRIENIELDDVLLRFSEDAWAPGVFSFMALQPDWSSGHETKEPLLPPSVRISSAVIELGVHVGSAYAPLGQRRVSGQMYPAADGGGWYNFDLTELDENGNSLGDEGLLIKGQWNVETLEHEARIEGLALDERTFSMCPRIARLWWQRMQPEGRVASAAVKWTKGQPFTAELVVDRMALTIPIATEDFWASYQRGAVEAAASRPRMRVNSGTIRLQGDRLTLEKLVGELGSSGTSEQLVGVPYRINLAIHDLPRLDWKNQQEWMEQLLATVPFEMDLDMNDFSLPPSTAPDAPAIELPRQVAETLAKFNMTGWSLSTQVQITRAPPVVGDDGQLIAQPIRTVGQALISEASGAYQAFPYPLEDVDAHVQFDSEQVTIDYLAGRGAGGSTVRMSGSIAPPGRDAAVSLRLAAREVPLDERFRRALRGGQLTTFDAMLHRASYEDLQEAGLLPDEAAMVVADHARQEKIAELVRLREADGLTDTASRRQRLEREIAQLRTLLEAGPFELGGRVDLDLTIERPRGPAQHTEITGTVSVHEAGVVYERFPYPIYVLGGTLNVQGDRIVVASGEEGEGLRIVTPGGGRGKVTGEVRLLQGEHGLRAEPDLTIELNGDSLNDLLYAALPLTDAEEEAGMDETPPQPGARRSRIARLLAEGGLSGWLDYAGTIATDAAGRMTYDFAVNLHDAAAEPTGELSQGMRELDLMWPQGLTLSAVEASLRISPEAIQLVDLAGRCGSGRITAAGWIDLESDPPDTRLTAHFSDLALQRYLVDLVPGEAEQPMADLWDRYQPQGTLHAKLHYHARGGESDRLRLVVWPNEIHAVIDGQPVRVIRQRGEVVLRPDQVTFDDLALRVGCGGRDDGAIVLNGSYGRSETSADLRLQGTWTAGQLASPLIPNALQLFGAERQAERYRSYEPSGTFDAEFTYESPRGDQPRDFVFAVRPDTVAVRLRDTRVYADLDQGAEFTFTPDRVALRDVAGKHAGGTFRIDGAVNVAGGIDADLQVEYFGRLDSPQLLACLPEPLCSVLETLELQAAEPAHLRDARLRLTQVESGKSGEGLQVAFVGRLETTGASFDAGVEFTDLDGVFELDAEHTPGAATRLDILARADHARVLGRELTQVEAKISLDDNGRVVTVPEFRAVLCGGVATAQVSVGLEPGSDYHAAIDLVGVSLEEFAATNEAAEPGEPASSAGNGNPPSGELYGSLRVVGRRGQPETRRGRGALRVAHGRMASMPVALRILQLFELMPPLSGTLDFADVRFYVNADRVVFERLFLECPTLQLIGEGEMEFPSMELDVRFRTRGTLPVVRDLIAGLSDQLFQVEVTGPLADPQARIVALPAVGQHRPTGRSVPVAGVGAE